MNSFLYSCKHMFILLKVDHKKFYLLAVQLCLAIALSYILISTLFSIHILEAKVKTSVIDNSIKISYRFLFTIDEFRQMLMGEKERIPPFTHNDFKEIEKFFKGQAEPFYFIDWNISLRNPSNHVNIKVRFTNALKSNECFIPSHLEGIIFDNSYKPIFGLKGKANSMFVANIREGKYQNIEMDEELFERHLVDDGINKVNKDELVLFPLDFFLENSHKITMVKEMIVIYFLDQFPAEGIFKTVKLLNHRHSEYYRYTFNTGYHDLKEKVLELRQYSVILSMVTGGVLVIIVFGMGGAIASLIKKRRKEVSIQLCLGIKPIYIYLENLLRILILSLISGIIGIFIGYIYISKLHLEVIKTPYIYMAGLISTGVICFFALLASSLPLIQLNQLKPVQILKAEQ